MPDAAGKLWTDFNSFIVQAERDHDCRGKQVLLDMYISFKILSPFCNNQYIPATFSVKDY